MTEPRPYRVLVTGTRKNNRNVRDAVCRALSEVETRVKADSTYSSMVVVHGACRYGGADQYADLWTVSNTFAAAEPHPATAPYEDPRARNSHMVKLGADECLAFPAPGSRGTWDCVRKACDAGIPITVIGVNP